MSGSMGPKSIEDTAKDILNRALDKGVKGICVTASGKKTRIQHLKDMGYVAFDDPDALKTAFNSLRDCFLKSAGIFVPFWQIFTKPKAEGFFTRNYNGSAYKWRVIQSTQDGTNYLFISLVEDK